MSEFTGLFCDECKTIKKASNHWHRIAVVYDEAEFQGAYRAQEICGDKDDVRAEKALLRTRPLRIELGNLNGADAGETYVLRDLCGDGCLQKHVMGLMSRVQIRGKQ